MALRDIIGFRLPVLVAIYASCGSDGQSTMPPPNPPPPTQCALGTTWSMVDDFALSPTNVYTFPQAYLVDKTSGIYVVHQGKDSTGFYNWVVRKSSDAGLTWTTIHTYQLVAGQNSTLQAGAAVDSAGNLYITGTGVDAGGLQHWVLRKSTDGGTNWITVNDYYNSSSAVASGAGLTIDASNTIYAVGHTLTAPSHVIVRKSTDGGFTFTVLDDFQYQNQYSTMAQGIRLDASGSIYVSGNGVDATGKRHAFIRKSAGGGSNFLTVDDFQIAAGKNTNPTVAYPMGNEPSLPLFQVVGSYGNTPDPNHWLIRRSVDAGTNWTTVDDPSPAPMINAGAGSISSDGFGGIVTVGAFGEGNTTSEVVRRSTDNGTTWTEYNRFTSANAAFPVAYPDLVFSDKQKNLFVAGYACDAAVGTSCRSFVRKLPCVTQ